MRGNVEGMSLEYAPGIAEMLDAVSDENRLQGLVLLGGGVEVKDLDDQLGVSRSTVQNYVDGYRQADLVSKRSGSFEVTRKGGMLLEWLVDLDSRFDEVMQGIFFDKAMEAMSDPDCEELEKMVGYMVSEKPEKVAAAIGEEGEELINDGSLEGGGVESGSDSGGEGAVDRDEFLAEVLEKPDPEIDEERVTRWDDESRYDRESSEE